jgi:hypothetical protein
MGKYEDDNVGNDDKGDEGKDSRLIIAEFLVNTPKDKISEVAPLPLDQHRPHSLLAMLSDVLRDDLCPKVIARQVKLNAIWGKYHKDKSGNPIIPVDLEKDKAWSILDLRDTKMEIWSYRYKQLRRGFINEGGMMLTTLAQAQMEAEPPDNASDVLKRLVKDRS